MGQPSFAVVLERVELVSLGPLNLELLKKPKKYSPKGTLLRPKIFKKSP